MEVGGDAERRGDGHHASEVVVDRDGVGDRRAVRGRRDDGLDAAALGVEGVGAGLARPFAVPKPFGDGHAAARAGDEAGDACGGGPVGLVIRAEIGIRDRLDAEGVGGDAVVADSVRVLGAGFEGGGGGVARAVLPDAADGVGDAPEAVAEGLGDGMPEGRQPFRKASTETSKQPNVKKTCHFQGGGSFPDFRRSSNSFRLSFHTPNPFL